MLNPAYFSGNYHPKKSAKKVWKQGILPLDVEIKGRGFCISPKGGQAMAIAIPLDRVQQVLAI